MLTDDFSEGIGEAVEDGDGGMNEGMAVTRVRSWLGEIVAG